MSLRASLLAGLALSVATGCATTADADAQRAALEERRLRLTANVVPDPATQARIETIACRLDASTCRKLRMFILRRNRPHADLIGDVMRISLGMLAATENDDALAFVIGHEMAHARVRHEPAAEPTRATEIEVEADAIALELMRDAGYSLRAGPELLARILARERASSNPSKEGIRQLEKRRNALVKRL